MRSRRERRLVRLLLFWFSYIGKEVNNMALIPFALLILVIWFAFDVVFNDKGDR